MAAWMKPAAAAAVAALPLVPRSWTSCEQKPGFVQAKCVKNEAHTHNTRLITLELPQTWTMKGPIANVLVRATVQEEAKGEGESSEVKVVRPYNPLSAEEGSSDVQLLVKKYDAAKMGTKLHDLQAGDLVEVKGPNQQWTFVEGKYWEYGMVAGGTGITPLIQAAEYILQHDTAKVTMLTFNKTHDDILLRERLAKLQATSNGRFKVFHVVEQGADLPSGEIEGKADDPEILGKLLPEPNPGVMVMVCGPRPMTGVVAGPKTKDMKQGEVGGVLKSLGYWTAQVW
eukprot:CAMPEP_0206565648 /NCGR_PEP_ID=MMETSP0325_2-20121206/24201_1 /ASSEMBLY_ACC=CAM_ASM_000347 /TAXON_ID=2866 /ORGANISM="Crypthecodinium cohnii, Strain Seligo" /LENGTH=284 /DNA_ID=CAMNT_0054068553 /DNA_START=86 /DNA_END=937 /DNA_ORIENTATION=+